MDLITIFSFLLYLGTFISCFLLDKKIKSPFGRKLVIGWIFVFLCFSYMNGSDWPNYEFDYKQKDFSSYIERGEYVTGYLLTICAKLNVDFWLFMGISKVFFLCSLLRMSEFFCKNKWTFLGLAFISYNLLFMVIDCPYRFMIATAFMNYSFPLALQKRWIKAGVFALLSLFSHISIIATFLVLATTYFAKYTVKINKSFLLILYALTYYIILGTSYLDSYMSIINLFYVDEGHVSFYMTDERVEKGFQSFLSIGNIKLFLLFILVLVNRDYIIKKKFGEHLYHNSIMFSYLVILLKVVPTGFRLTIFSSTFTVIILFIILSDIKLKQIKYNTAILLTILFFNLFNFSKNLYQTASYIPYSNSIPYILTDHKPYNERIHYNLNAQKKRIGTNIE